MKFFCIGGMGLQFSVRAFEASVKLADLVSGSQNELWGLPMMRTRAPKGFARNELVVECAKDTIVRYLFLRKSHDERGSGKF